MAQPYIGEIKIFAGSFAPNGWLFCEGQLLPISENEALFQLIGTTYGGDGETTFGLPDLRGRIPVHQGALHPFSEMGGTETVTLNPQQIPVHSHALVVSTSAAEPTAGPDGSLLADTGATELYVSTGNPPTPMHGAAVAALGGSQPHGNLAPYLCVNFIISLFGIFPSQT
jgi:microcystin-dependent protein